MARIGNKNIIKNSILFVTICIIVILTFFVRELLHEEKTQSVEIVRNGTITDIYPLTEEKIIRVADEQGRYNIIEISQGSVRVIEADCSNQDCVRQGRIAKSGESIICLPHQLVIRIKGVTQEYDAVSW